MYRILLLLLLLVGAPEALAVHAHLPVVELLSSQEEPDQYYFLQQLSHTTESIQAQPDLWLREVSFSLPVPKLVAGLVAEDFFTERTAHNNRALLRLAPKTSPPFVGS